MSALRTLPPDHVMRLAATVAGLPIDQCAIPERCETRECADCHQPVHYDPKACIPLLGPEHIVCDDCMPYYLDGLGES